MLKQKQQRKIIPQDYRRCLSCQSLSDKRQWAAKTQWCCSQHPLAQATKGHPSQSPSARIVSSASNHDAQLLWVGSRWTQSSKMDRASRTQRKQFFAGTVWAAWHQKSDNPALRAYTRFPDTPCSSQQGCVTLQKLPPRMLHCQSHTELAQGWPVRC